MRSSGKNVAAVLLLFFFVSTAPSTADIISTKIRSDNRDTILFSDNFVFSHAGYVSVAVSSVEISPIPVTSQLPDSSRIGFFLLSFEFAYRYDDEFERNPDLCPLDIKFISVLFTFGDLSLQSSFNKSYNVTYPGGMYSLYFVNCNNLSFVTMDVRTELYNTDDEGTRKDYLSAWQPQPSFYLKILLIYLCLLGFWISVSFKNQDSLEMIHLVMGVLLVMNIFHCICGMADQHELKVTGTHNYHHRWRILFYASRFMRDMYFFIVIVLIGAGWCNWRRGLPKWVIFNMTVVILLEVWANVSFVEVWESGPYNEDWLDLRARFTTIDIMCCLFVLLHTYCSGLSFKNATDTSTFVRSYASFKGVTYRQDVFPLLLFGYIEFTRVLNIVLRSTAIQETSSLVFSIAVFYMYRPFVLDHEDQKCAGFLDHVGVV